LYEYRADRERGLQAGARKSNFCLIFGRLFVGQADMRVGHCDT
jgi:hypothetical protein